MRKLIVVLGLGALLVGVLAAPALSGDDRSATSSANVEKTVKKALKTAKAAKRSAKSAKRALDGKEISTASFEADGSTRQASGSIIGATREGEGSYTAAFDRSVASCEVLAQTGHTTADPLHLPAIFGSGPSVTELSVRVFFPMTSEFVDDPFTIIAFC